MSSASFDKRYMFVGALTMINGEISSIVLSTLGIVKLNALINA